MIKIFVDSGSSIKQEEKEKYGVEILPLRIFLGDKEYLDGVDLTMEGFYHALIEEKIFPKTSLPSPTDAEERVRAAINDGYDVLIITFASALSGTYSAFKSMFRDEPRVRVVDSRSAVGAIKILVLEANKYLDRSLDFVEGVLNELIMRVKVLAVPDTLEYLYRGGRLSRASCMLGSILQLKPIISLIPEEGGKTTVVSKERGKRNATRAIAEGLKKYECDENYPIVPSYTYDRTNLDALIEATDEKYKAQMTEYDHVDPAVACHWGPGAYGYMFVAKKP